MAKFVTIGERLSTTAPAVNKAFTERDPEPIIKRAKQQLDAGATYLDVNIGPAENDGEDLMKWAVQLLQSEFDNVPLALDTTNKKAIEAGISVYNRAKGKPIVNSADAGDRITNIMPRNKIMTPRPMATVKIVWSNRSANCAKIYARPVTSISPI